MRRSLVIDALFPQVRGRILAATFARPEKPWYLTELSAFLHTQPSSLQREIDALSHAGLLKQWRDGRRLYLQADSQSPVFSEIRRLFEKTTGLIPVLQQALASRGDRIRLAFIYGSAARSKERSESDVDLLVVGSDGLSDLLPSLRRAEQTLGRPVNATAISVEELAERARIEDHFFTRLLQEPKQFVKGSQRELDAIASQA